MGKRRPPDPSRNYDYTGTQRTRAARDAAAARLDVLLSAEDAAELSRVLAATGETKAAWVRRMIAQSSAAAARS